MYKDDKKVKTKNIWQKIWWFIWDDDSVWSWLVNIVLAFIIIKFLLYPGIGLALGTTHPVVAVVSGSMEHKIAPDAFGRFNLCSEHYDKPEPVNFDFFWKDCGGFYSGYNISKEEFSKFSFKNGFNTGDIIVLVGKKPKDIKVGEVIVFKANQPDPIIHRIINKWEDGGVYHFTTKGDHNSGIIMDPNIYEIDITQDRIIGKAIFRIPALGYIKIWFVQLLQTLHLDKSVGKLF